MLVENGAARAFERADAGVGINGDDEDFSFRFRSGEIAGMTDVERIEDAVGEDDALATLSGNCQQPDQFIARNDFFVGLAHGSGRFAGSGGADGFEEFGARDGGGAALHDS